MIRIVSFGGVRGSGDRHGLQTRCGVCKGARWVRFPSAPAKKARILGFPEDSCSFKNRFDAFERLLALFSAKISANIRRDVIDWRAVPGRRTFRGFRGVALHVPGRPGEVVVSDHEVSPATFSELPIHAQTL